MDFPFVSHVARGLDGHDRRKLLAAVRRARDGRLLKRLQAVLLLAQGQGVAQACAVTGLCRQSVYNALDRYRRRHHPADLADAPRSGRPAAAPKISGGRIGAALRRDPMKLGYNATTWTVDLLARHLSDRFGQAITSFTIRRRMHTLGLRWKRPRYVYHLKDPHKAQKKGGLCDA